MDKQEEWRVISEFPLYSVSSKQRVKNNKTGRIKKSIVMEQLVLALAEVM